MSNSVFLSSCVLFRNYLLPVKYAESTLRTQTVIPPTGAGPTLIKLKVILYISTVSFLLCYNKYPPKFVEKNLLTHTKTTTLR